jgi:hypothetical protein
MLVASHENPADFPAQILKGGIRRRTARIEDHSPRGRKFIHPAANGLAHAALDAVAEHRFPQGARQSEAETGLLKLLLRVFAPEAKGRKVPASHAYARFIDRAEV